MKAWSSFSATDINNDNELNIEELKVLIWLVDGEEPDGNRVKRDMKLIDEDGGGTIDRMEWINYLANPKGNYFNAELKKQFDECDEDNSGSIDIDEFVGIFIQAWE